MNKSYVLISINQIKNKKNILYNFFIYILYIILYIIIYNIIYKFLDINLIKYKYKHLLHIT